MKRLALLAGLLVSLVAVGCGGGGGGDDTPEASGSSPLRVVHNSADAPNVDVYLDGELILSDVPYLAVSEYLTVNEGPRSVRVTAAGTDTAVIDTTLNVESDKPCSIIANNLVGSIDALILDDEFVLGGPETSRVRIVHGAPSAPGVDIYLLSNGATLESSNANISNLLFGENTGYLDLVAGDYEVVVTVAGTKDVAIDAGTVNLPGNTNLSVFAVDAVGGGAPFSLNIIVDAVPPA